MTERDDEFVGGCSSLDPPVAGTAGARAMMHRLSRDLFDVEMGAVTLGRFEIVVEIGAGGMGIVYRAKDPKVGREVALKLLRRGISEEQRTRLSREAQALALLNDPNVVQLYELYDDEEGLFLVMEYVEGRSLEHWQRERGWREIIHVYVQAGRGLAAAHAAELIHRDFKPANVIVGDDGRARVADFGLARFFGLPSDSEGEAETTGERSARSSPTRTGAVVGTPGYMSPEQVEQRELDASSDQFSFCVALCESILGERPSVGASAEQLLAGIRQRPAKGEPAAPGWSMSAAVQRRFVRTMVRGLQGAAHERWPDMGELLEVLEQLEPKSRWRGPGVVLAIGGLGLFVGRTLTPTGSDPACAALEQIAPRWTDEHAAEIDDASSNLPIEGQEILAHSVDEHLSAYARQWEATAAEVCEPSSEASTIGDSGPCLERLAADFGRVGAALRERPEMLLGAHEALALLVPPEVCGSSPQLVLADEGLDADALLELTRAGILAGAGRNAEALGIYDALERRAEDSTLLGARLALGRGRLLFDSGDAPTALTHFERAVERALLTGAQSLVASSLAALASAHADVEDYASATTTARWCLASASRSLLPVERAECLVASALASRGSEPSVTLERLEEALSVRRGVYGDGHPSEGPLNRLIANTYADLGQLEESRRRYVAEQERLGERYGSQHPAVSSLDYNLAILDVGEQKLPEAAARLAGVVRSFEAVYGSSPRLAAALRLLAMVEANQGKLEEATHHCERAIELEASLPPEHPESGAALTLAGELARVQLDLPGALARYEQLAALRGTEVQGERSLVWHNVAYYRCVLNGCRGAQEALDHADRKAVEDGGVEVRHYAAVIESMVALSVGDATHARSLAEQALRSAVRDEASDARALEAEARWSLARAARMTGDDDAALEQAILAIEVGAQALAALEHLDPVLFDRVRSLTSTP